MTDWEFYKTRPLRAVARCVLMALVGCTVALGTHTDALLALILFEVANISDSVDKGIAGR